jgi:hypothetical protein
MWPTTYDVANHLRWGQLPSAWAARHIDHNIRVKASDVFRNNFAGKINRQATETALGP